MNGAKDKRVLEQLLVCPYDYAEFIKSENGYVCKGCSRTFPITGNVINFLAYEDEFKSLSYEIPWHSPPKESGLNKVRSWLRSLPIYHRLVITSNHFSFYLERYIYKKMKGRKIVLDIGCREGHNLMFGKRAELAIGVDIDRDSVAYANRWSPDNCHALLAAGTRLPFKDGSFDFVICTEVIEHLKNCAGLVDEIARVTKRGGEVLLTTPDGDITPIPDNPLHLKHFKETELLELCGKGFSKVNIQSIVVNCEAKKRYWKFESKNPGKLPLIFMNAITNLVYYFQGYHKAGSYKRNDVLGAQFVVLAIK